MEIVQRPLTANQYIALCRDSGLRRPIDQPDRIARMIGEANIFLSCWFRGQPIAMLRAWSDWVYVCYIADLAVARPHQRQGIGRALIEHLRALLGQTVQLVVVAAAEATSFYHHLGFEKSQCTFLVRRKQ